MRRNERCACGSGKRHKHCCGGTHSEAVGMTDLKQAAQARMALEVRRHDAREHQRRLMQGLGRPIISWENGEHRFVPKYTRGVKIFCERQAGVPGLPPPATPPATPQ